MASESGPDQKPLRILGSSSGFCYSISSDVSSNTNNNLVVMNQMQSFDEAANNNQADQLFNLTTGIELLAFPSKNISGTSSSAAMWKGFFNTNKQPTTSITNPSPTDFYQTSLIPDHTTTSHGHDINLLVSPHPISSSSWQDNDSSLRYHVFPSHQGLSLSLSTNKASSSGIKGLQSFDDQLMRETNHHHHHHHHHHQLQQQEDEFFGKSINFHQQNQIMQDQDDQFLGKTTSTSVHHQMQPHFQFKNSKYLLPAQELLNEFCSIGTKQSSDHHHHHPVPKQKNQKTDQLGDENGGGSSGKQSFLYSLDLLELQKRKTKLVSMLEEVDKRYRQYCDQMKAVVASFEAVVGDGAASGYSALASKAMSKHFRCLRDGIVEQIKAIKKAIGEKDPVAPGTTKGETPRLRLLDQTLRQQKAFQQMSMMENHPWRPQRGLPERSVSVLRSWLFEHFLHPYPSEVDKHILARQAGLSRSQVSNWFINARVRLWKPMVEEMYLEETKEQDNIIASSSSDHWVAVGSLDDNNRLPIQDNLSQFRSEDQKPTPDQLARGDSESLSSIINMPDKLDHNENGRISNNQHYHHYHQHQAEQQQRRLQLGRVPGNESFGVTDLDFSSYGNAGSLNHHQSNLGNGISLTLGLQQHGGSGGMSLSFSPVSQHSLFFPRDQIGDCDEQVQYSILDGEAQTFPYRNLMEAQLLNDLAG